jgi:hypothetical protein
MKNIIILRKLIVIICLKIMGLSSKITEDEKSIQYPSRKH